MKDPMKPMNEPKISFKNSADIDAAFLLHCLSPKSLFYDCKQNIQWEHTLLQACDEFAEKSGLYSPRDGLPKFHFLCASLADSQGSVFPDVDNKYRNLLNPFQALIARAKALYSGDKKVSDLGDFERLWKTRYSSLEKAQEIARIKFRLPEYSVFLLLSLSGRFGMPCMVHDKYIFINSQRGQESFIVEATFHELLHQLLTGYRCATEGKFFTGHFLWQPRRAMVEEIVLPCLQMELCEDHEEREKGRECVLHLEEHRPFLKPFRSIFSKILHDWEENYVSSQDTNLQVFIDLSTRRYLKPLKFVSLMKQMNVEKVRQGIRSRAEIADAG
jgi:hypothetical protein